MIRLTIVTIFMAIFAGTAHAAPQRPNIVVILADDMGVGDIAYGNKRARVATPHLDALAAGGMRFDDAHSSSSVCTPTRYALLTGRYSWRSELKDRVTDGFGRALLAPGQDTIGSLLGRGGYRTAMIGKWHVGMDWPLKGGGYVTEFRSFPKKRFDEIDYAADIRGGPIDLGFDTFYGLSASLDFYPYSWIEGNRVTSVPTEWMQGRGDKDDRQPFMRAGPASPGFDPQGVMEEMTARSEAFIARQTGERPFFLYLSLTAPHTPVLPEAEFAGSSKAGAYGDFIQQLDATVGRVVASLEAAGQLENTLILFTADNGAARASFSEEQESEFGHHPSGPYRGRKASLYEGGHRVPLIAHWPGGIRAGSRSDALVGLNDLYATFADLAGSEAGVDGGEDSVSFAPVLSSPAGRAARSDLVLRDFAGALAYRQGHWVLLMGRRPRQVELFDLASDPQQQNDLASLEQDRVAAMRDALTETILAGRSTPGPARQNEGPDRWPMLHWLED